MDRKTYAALVWNLDHYPRELSKFLTRLMPGFILITRSDLSVSYETWTCKSYIRKLVILKTHVPGNPKCKIRVPTLEPS